MVVTKKFSSVTVAAIGALLVLFGIGESVVGWLQVFGLKASGHVLYPATGTFYNPGPYCGSLAMLMPMALFYTLEKKLALPYWLSAAYLLLSLPLLPVLLGRTGWIAAAAGCLYVAFALGRIRFPRGYTLVLWCAVVAACCVFAVYLKPDSALGRLLIWRNGVSALVANPGGAGYDRVAGELGAAQERYFGSHSPGVFDSVAGSPEFAFNDFLQTGIAFGFAGLLIFISLLAAAFVSARRSKEFGAAGSLVSFSVVCFASYPMQFPEFVGALAALLAIALLSNARIKTPVATAATLVVVLGAATVIYGMADRRTQAEKWSALKNAYQYGLSGRDETRLDSMAAELAWSPAFHFDYGKMLRDNSRYGKSTDVLKKGMALSSDPMFLNIIGRNFQSTGQYDSAAHYYRRSARRLPGRLYPYYLLAKLYADSASCDSAAFMEVYRDAMSLVPKVMSPAIRDMRKELRALNDSIAGLK